MNAINTEATENRRLIEAVIRVEAMGRDITEIKATTQQLATAISKMTLIEERQANDREAQTRIFGILEKHDGRINTLELAQPLQNQTTDWVNKAMWLVVGAVLSAVVAMVVFNRATDVHRPATPIAPTVVVVA
jgi:hypothetical protein